MDEKKRAEDAARHLLSPMGRLEKNLGEIIVNIIEAKAHALAVGDGVNLELLEDAEKAVKKVMKSLWEE